MVELEERIDEVTRERDIALKEKSQILDEVEYCQEHMKLFVFAILSIFVQSI